MKNLSRCSFALAALMVLHGCGGGSSDSNKDVGIVDNGPGSDNDEPDREIVTMFAMEGDLKFDYSLREYGGSDFVYSTDLALKITTEFSEGEYIATNLFVGGMYTDDYYSPAIISASEIHIRVASRIDGSSTTIDIPSQALQEQRVPCRLAATSNTTGSVGVIAVELAESFTDYCGTNAETWVYSYLDGNGTWWKADGEIDAKNIFYTSAGEVDFIVSTNYSDGSASIYSAQGTLLKVLSSSAIDREIEVLPLDSDGVTRDDSYVAIIIEATIRVASRRMLLESGIEGSHIIESDLSTDRQVMARVTKFNAQGIILRSGSDLILIDSVRRVADKVADLSALNADSWELDELYVHGNQLFLILLKYDAVGNDHRARGKLVGVDLANIGAGIEDIVTSQSMIRQARATNAMFFNHTTESNVQRSIVVQGNGSRSVSGEHHHYVSGINLEKGGKDIETFLLRADSATEFGNLVDPAIWTVNEFTGNQSALAGNMSGECEWFQGRYGVGSNVNVATMCDGLFAWRRVDTGTGGVYYISSNWQLVF